MQTHLGNVLLIAAALTIAPAQFPGLAQENRRSEINTILMESTFRIDGEAVDGKTTTGTFFVLGRPYPDGKRHRYTLVTANHVLDAISARTATVFFRRRSDDEGWTRHSQSLEIRNKEGEPLWTRHPSEDVAAMYITVPNNFIATVVSTSLLADDQMLERYEVHSGDRLICLGYPFGAEGNTEGFPILRSGQIASYPLLPTRDRRTFLFDFEVFGGNSGGPVYLTDSNRVYDGATHIGTVGFLVGLVSEQFMVTHRTKTPYRVTDEMTPLGLAIVVHAVIVYLTPG